MMMRRIKILRMMGMRIRGIKMMMTLGPPASAMIMMMRRRMRK